MNPADTLVQSLQTGFRVTIGAATTLAEGIQDPVKREAAMETFQLDWDSMTSKLAEKGEVTERETRELIERTLNLSNATASSSASSPSTTQTTTSQKAAQDLRDLTEELTALRQELEELRSKS